MANSTLIDTRVFGWTAQLHSNGGLVMSCVVSSLLRPAPIPNEKMICVYGTDLLYHPSNVAASLL